MKNPENNIVVQIPTEDFIKLSHLDVLDDLIKNSADKAVISDSKDVMNLAEIIATEYRELFVQNFMERYNKEVKNFASLIEQVRS